MENRLIKEVKAIIKEATDLKVRDEAIVLKEILDIINLHESAERKVINAEMQIKIRSFDLPIADATLSNGQAVQIINYARRIGVNMFQYEPVPSIDTHNLIATYVAGTNPND